MKDQPPLSRRRFVPLATGLRGNVMRFCAPFLLFWNIRAGLSPQEACVATIEHITKMDPTPAEEQHIHFIAIDKQGRYPVAGTGKGFEYPVAGANSSKILKSAIAP